MSDSIQTAGVNAGCDGTRRPYQAPAVTRREQLSRVAAGGVSPSGADKNLASDVRQKTDIEQVGTLTSGINLYRFRYLWSEEVYVGVMAQEVLPVVPDAVIQGEDGYYKVDYARLGTRMITYSEWLARKADPERLAA